MDPSPRLQRAPLYDRRSRIALEISILCLTLLDLVFVIPYIINLWRAPLEVYAESQLPPRSTKE